MQSASHIRPFAALLRPSSHPSLQICVRYGGGGGRPGARPAFSWKQKNQLGIDGKKRVEFSAHPAGTDLTDLTNFFSEARGDVEFDLTNVENWTEPTRPVVNKYKVIDVSSLYGSNKPFGPIVVDHVPYTGPFTRKRMSKGKMV